MYRPRIESLPVAHFAFPGPLRERLVAAILAGEKTATSSLLLEHELEGDPLPEVGRRDVVVDSDERPVCVIETTEVRVLALRDVDDDFARDEGEGFASAREWRAAHENFWHRAEMRAVLGRPDFRVDDTTLVVAERFRLVERLG